jgi:phage gp36-like protein
MSYATPADVTAAYPQKDLVELTNEDPQVAEVNQGFLQDKLDSASDIIDSYLESRFTLPFPSPPGPPKVLKAWCIDIAIYRLQCLRPLHDAEDARKRYEDAIDALTKVNQGKLTLGLSASDGEPPPADPSVKTLAGGQASQLVRIEAAAARGLAPMFDRLSLRTY